MRDDLERLLHPFTARVFFEDYYEKKLLHVGGREAGYFAHLFSPRDVEVWLWQQETRLNALIRVSKAGEVIRAPDNIERGYRDWLFQQYKGGATFITHGLERSWYPVALLQRALEPALRSRVHINAYVSPPGAQGFSPHFDVHDTLILQTSGRKRWRIYHSPIELPLKSQFRDIDPQELGPPAHDFVLEEGDTLYVPRGFIHEAMTAENASIHLTAGLHPFLWVDLLQESVLTVAEGETALRRSVPPQASLDADELQATLSQLLHAGAGKADGGTVLRRFEERFLGGMQALPGGHIADPAPFESLSVDQRVEKQPGVLCFVVSGKDRTAIEFPGTGAREAIAGPPSIEPALRFVAESHGPFAIADLPGLSDASKLVLARRLLREGLLRLGE